MNSFPTVLTTQIRLTMRDFFTVFFALVFPPLMLYIFGSIFGAYPGQTGAAMLDDMTPACCCMIMGVTGLMGFPLTLAAGQEQNIYRRFDATPAGRLPVLGAECLANLLLTLAGTALLLLFAAMVFGTEARGDTGSILGAMVLACGSLFALGFFIAAAAPSPRIALTVSYTVYFVMLFLSGATLPVVLFPASLKTVSDCLPMTYAVRLLQDAWNGISSPEMTDDVLILLTVLAGCSLGGILFLRYRPVHERK